MEVDTVEALVCDLLEEIERGVGPLERGCAGGQLDAEIRRSWKRGSQ